MENYSITFISTEELDKNIKESIQFKDCKTRKVYGLTGVETTTIVLQSIQLAVGLLGVLLQYEAIRRQNKEFHNSETNTSQGDDAAEIAQKYVTVKGPDGIEFSNVPMSDLPELIEVIKSFQDKKDGF